MARFHMMIVRMTGGFIQPDMQLGTGGEIFQNRLALHHAPNPISYLCQIALVCWRLNNQHTGCFRHFPRKGGIFKALMVKFDLEGTCLIFRHLYQKFGGLQVLSS